MIQNNEEEQPTPIAAGELWRKRLQSIIQRLRSLAPFVMGVLAAFLALILYHLVLPGPQSLTLKQVDQAVAAAMASATPPPAYSAQVYAAVQPALVLIQAASPPSGGENGHDLSLGSGVVIDQQGDILTALHVVDGANSIQVTFADGTQSSAHMVSNTPERDIAVLSADTLPAKIFPAVLGNPHGMRVGDDAYAVGNPFGLYGSMSAGVISGFDRFFVPPDGKQRLDGLIQIDAAVNPGNSGGPLLNRNGQVIGIVVGIINPTKQDVFIGIGFAVPIDVAAAGAGLPPY